MKHIMFQILCDRRTEMTVYVHDNNWKHWFYCFGHSHSCLGAHWHRPLTHTRCKKWARNEWNFLFPLKSTSLDISLIFRSLFAVRSHKGKVSCPTTQRQCIWHVITITAWGGRHSSLFTHMLLKAVMSNRWWFFRLILTECNKTTWEIVE